MRSCFCARIALALVAARMIHLSSEREASRWLQADSALPELLGLTGKRTSLLRKTLYRVCYLLWKNRAALQLGLWQASVLSADILAATRYLFRGLANANN